MNRGARPPPERTDLHLTWTQYHVLWTLMAEAMVASAWGVTVSVMFMAGLTPRAVRRSRRDAVRTGVFALILLVHMGALVLAVYGLKHPLRAAADAGAATAAVLGAFLLWTVFARLSDRRRQQLRG